MPFCLLILLLALTAPAADNPAPPATNTLSVTINLAATNRPAAPTDTNSLPDATVLELVDPTNPFATVPGLRVQLAAADPLIGEPTALAFDAAGRLFVAERLADNRGRISVLRDADHDGTFEQQNVWAENLPVPTGLVCYGGGAFVAAGREILFLKNTTTNSFLADERRVVFSGFSTNTSPVQLAWAPDHRIHVTVPQPGITLQRTAAGNPALPLNGDDFAFDPRTLAVIREPGGTHTAIGFDQTGRRFTSSATQPLRLTMTSPEAATRNPFFVWPELLADLVPESRQSVQSLHVYGGGVLPTNFNGNIFVADPAAGVIRRLALRENGLTPKPEVPRGQRDAVFLRALDSAFRPVQIISGPEGALFIADLARENPTNRLNGGRIWRVSPANVKPQRLPDLTTLNTPALVNLLTSPNGWARDTAARLLFERNAEDTPAHLRRDLLFGRSSPARSQSLHLLYALNALTLDDLLHALADGDASVREAAVQLAATWVNANRAPDNLLNALANRASDSALRVRYQLALTLGGSTPAQTAFTLAELLRGDYENRWMQAAVFGGADGRAEVLFTELVANARFRQSGTGWTLLIALAEMAGHQAGSNGDAVLLAIERARLNTESTFTLTTAMGRGLHNSGRTFVSAAPQGTWRRFADAALEVVVSNQSTANRAAAARYLGVSGFTAQQVADWSLALLVPGEPQAVQSATIETLAHFDDPVITTAYIQRWQRLPDTSRREILGALLRRPDRTYFLMNALEDRRIPVSALNPFQANFLRTHYDANTAARAQRLLGRDLNRRAGLTERFAPTVFKQEGSAARGRAVFQNRCATCHRANGEGRAFGPDLDAAAPRLPEELLADILEPNRRITASHQTQVVQRTNGDFLVGLVQATGPNTDRVRLPDGPATFVPRAQINATIPQEWSLMPEDAAAGLTATQLADLLAFLQQRK